MAKQLFANNATGYLNASITNIQTSIILQTGNGATFPSPTSGDYFYATIFDGISNIEIVKVTARSVDTLTVVRGQDGTSAVSFPTGSIIEVRAVKGNYENLAQKTGDTVTDITVDTLNSSNVNITGGSVTNLTTLGISGTGTAPTKAYGTNTTDIATTAFVQTALRAIYPVGSVYINASSTTNPATLLGFGTWAEIGAGRVLVGQNTGDASFDVLGETGGSKDNTLVAHTHTFSANTGNQSNDHTHNVSDPGHSHSTGSSGASGTAGANLSSTAWGSPSSTGVSGTGISLSGVTANHTHAVSGTTDSTGSSGTNANLQPYVVVKMWQRTA